MFGTRGEWLLSCPLVRCGLLVFVLDGFVAFEPLSLVSIFYFEVETRHLALGSWLELVRISASPLPRAFERIIFGFGMGKQTLGLASKLFERGNREKNQIEK